MDPLLIERLARAESDEERQAVVLEMSLAVLPESLQRAVQVAAIPHWFDALFFEALWGGDAESRALYDQLIELSFVELIPGRGYALHELIRQHLLGQLWQTAPDDFRSLSDRASAYAAERGDASHWRAETTYHLLLSETEQGISMLQDLATDWANYEYHSYEEIEQVVRLAGEHIATGRLTGRGADAVYLWQSRLALIYQQPELANASLVKIEVDPLEDLRFAAEVANTLGDLLVFQDDDGFEQAWRNALDLYRQAGDPLDAYLVAEKLQAHGVVVAPLPVGDEITDRQSFSPKPPSINDRRLIDNIEQAWINGVLRQALREDLDLQLERGLVLATRWLA